MSLSSCVDSGGRSGRNAPRAMKVIGIRIMMSSANPHRSWMSASSARRGLRRFICWVIRMMKGASRAVATIDMSMPTRIRSVLSR